MGLDLSRVTFNPRQDFFGVVMQQGRVQLDSDWNAWLKQLARRLQAGTLDVFDGTVVPRQTPEGFLIDVAGGNMTIGPGRIYVDGILAENHGGSPEAWDPLLAEKNGTTAIDYTDQPYLPNPPDLPQSDRHLVYLDVWQRVIGPVEHPDLIEPAVGVDTTGRIQTVWQVRLVEDVGDDVTCATDDDDIPGWAALTAPSAGRLSTDTATPETEDNPCEVPPAAGYLGRGNQSYRIEVHEGGPLGTATFKWSRENASVAARVTNINPARTRVTVDSLGRDDVLTFADGNWVEVTDDWRVLNGLPGELRRIAPVAGVDRTARTLTFESALTDGLFPTDAQQATETGRNTIVRRWDQSGDIRTEANDVHQNVDATGGAITIPGDGTRLFLEHGILVDFSTEPGDGLFRSGDHWIVAARTSDATVEILDRAAPLGIHHHYARLAVVEFPDSETNCRTLWPPLFEGGDSCACTICVSPEEHNAGTATIQQAIDAIKDVGGTICLDVGTYAIDAPLRIDRASSLTIRGQGWRTLLTGQEVGNIFEITGGVGVTLEEFTAIASAGNSELVSAVSATGVADLTCHRLNLIGIGVGDGTGIGVGLSGVILRGTITECVIFATRGISSLTFDGDLQRPYLLTAEMLIERNAIIALRDGIRLAGEVLHFGDIDIARNLVISGTEGAGIALTGASLPGARGKICDNAIWSVGDGLQIGASAMKVCDNTLTSIEDAENEGITVTQGLAQTALEGLEVTGNTITDYRGHGVLVTQGLVDATISGNTLARLGQGGIIMSEDASARHLRIESNRLTEIGLAVSSDLAYAGIQIIAVEECDVIGNRLDTVAPDAFGSRDIAALRTLHVGRLRANSNRIRNVGPITGRRVAGLRATPGFESVTASENTILWRSGNIVTDPDNPSGWIAIDISLEGIGVGRHLAAANFLWNGELAYLLTATRLRARQAAPSTALIRGNETGGDSSSQPINRIGDPEIAFLSHCHFTANLCTTTGSMRDPSLAFISARTITFTENRLQANFDGLTAFLQPGSDVAIVMGNTSTGLIDVSGGVVPPDINFTNLIGI